MRILHLTRSAVNYRISYLWLFFFVKWEFNDIRVAGYVMMLVNTDWNRNDELHCLQTYIRSSLF